MRKECSFVVIFLCLTSFAYGENYFSIGYEYGFLWESIGEKGAALKTATSGPGVAVELVCLSSRNMGVVFHGRILFPHKAQSAMSGGSGYNPDDYNTNIVEYLGGGIGFAFRIPVGGRVGIRAGLGFNYAFFVNNETKQTYSGGRFSYQEMVETRHIGLAGNAGIDFNIAEGWFVHAGVSLIFDVANSNYPSLFEPPNSVVPYEQTYSFFMAALRIGAGFRF